jgi:hypothetical protein
MAKRSRPAQGNNTNRRITKLAAGGTNERVIAGPYAGNSKRRALMSGVAVRGQK